MHIFYFPVFCPNLLLVLPRTLSSVSSQFRSVTSGLQDKAKPRQHCKPFAHPTHLPHKKKVYLGPEITVQVTGQRALAILSRGSLVLNTSITAEPSTLGGFPGGGGIARDPGGGADLLLSPPSVPPEFDLSSLVNGTLERVGESGLPSYNVNGPGSASYRYYLFTITTSADDVDDVQRVSFGWIVKEMERLRPALVRVLWK